MTLNRKLYLGVFLTLFAFTACQTQGAQKSQVDFSRLKGPYLGQKPPGMAPELFAPGVITTDGSEGCSGWGKGMEYFIFQRWIDRKPRLYIMNQNNGVWSPPEPLPFLDKYQAGDFTIAPDGKTMVFASRISTEYHEWDTYIAPDESYMIYCSTMPGGLGDDDLYVTFKQQDGSWSEPVHMGAEINSDKSENRPYVSPDGRYLFYASTKRGNRDIYWVDAKIIEALRPRE